MLNSDLTSANTSPDAMSTRKLSLFHTIGSRLPLKYAWNFYEDRHSTTSDYERRLILKHENIINVQMFWQFVNNYPFQELCYRDSVHFFLRGIKPVWEDRRNRDGGAWVFRLPNKGTHIGESGQPEDFSPAQYFLESILMAAVGRSFDVCMQGIDDANPTSNDYLCGISMSNRDKSSLISIWNRRGDNEQTKQKILEVVYQWISSDLKKLLDDKPSYYQNYYYKKHSEHKGFDEVVAKAKEAENVKSSDAEV